MLLALTFYGHSFLTCNFYIEVAHLIAHLGYLGEKTNKTFLKTSISLATRLRIDFYHEAGEQV